MESVSVKVARAFIARATESGKTKGVKRDRDALEFICGAAAACKAFAENHTGVPSTNASESFKTLEGAAFMVSIDGYAYLEKLVKDADA